MLRSLSNVVKQAPGAARHMSSTTSYRTGGLTWLYGHHFDPKELIPLATMMSAGVLFAVFTLNRTLFSNEQGAYMDPRTRMNLDEQASRDSTYEPAFMWRLTRPLQDQYGAKARKQ